MDEAVLVNLAERGRQSAGEPQELAQFQRRSNEPIQGFATWIFEYEHRAALVPGEPERHDGPGGVQFGTQQVFVFQAAETAGSRVLPERRDQESRLQTAIGCAPAPDTVKPEFS